MKTTVLSVLGCALLAAGVIQARAQTTNVLLNVNIALSGVEQTDSETTTRVHIGTKDVIAAIGAATTNTFSPRARLLVLANSGGGPGFIIRDGNPTNDFAVPGGMLTVANVRSVGTTRTNATGVITGAETSIDRFALDTPTLAFDVQGYTILNTSNRGAGRNLLDDTSPVSVNSKVNGVGTRAGLDNVLQGIISASGRKIEITP